MDGLIPEALAAGERVRALIASFDSLYSDTVLFDQLRDLSRDLAGLSSDDLKSLASDPAAGLDDYRNLFCLLGAALPELLGVTANLSDVLARAGIASTVVMDRAGFDRWADRGE